MTVRSAPLQVSQHALHAFVSGLNLDLVFLARARQSKDKDNAKPSQEQAEWGLSTCRNVSGMVAASSVGAHYAFLAGVWNGRVHHFLGDSRAGAQVGKAVDHDAVRRRVEW